MNRTAAGSVALVLVLLAGACSEDAGDADEGSTTDTGEDTATESDTGEGDSDSGEYEEIEWVPIPAGSFEMGCSPNDTECSAAEEPAHTVEVPEFEMTRTEITQGQYEAETGENPSRYIGCASCPVDTYVGRGRLESQVKLLLRPLLKSQCQENATDVEQDHWIVRSETFSIR